MRAPFYCDLPGGSQAGKGNVMKKKVIICDPGRDYPALLGRYIKNAGRDLVLQTEGDIHAAAELHAENRNSYLLVAEDLWNSCPKEVREKIRKDGKYCFLSDDQLLPEGRDRIYRYRTADEVAERLAALFGEPDGQGAKLIGVLSPSGGVCAELCAQLIMEMLTEQGKAFGVSFYPFSVFRSTAGEETLSSVLYRCKAGAEDLVAGVPPAGRLLCVSDPRDIWEMGEEEAADLLTRLKMSAGASCIIAAVPPLKTCESILDECAHMLLVNEAGALSKNAVGAFSEYLVSSGADDLPGKMTELSLPPLPAVSDLREAYGILRHGGFYMQVREVLKLAGVIE